MFSLHSYSTFIIQICMLWNVFCFWIIVLPWNHTDDRHVFLLMCPIVSNFMCLFITPYNWYISSFIFIFYFSSFSSYSCLIISRGKCQKLGSNIINQRSHSCWTSLCSRITWLPTCFEYYRHISVFSTGAVFRDFLFFIIPFSLPFSSLSCYLPAVYASLNMEHFTFIRFVSTGIFLLNSSELK